MSEPDKYKPSEVATKCERCGHLIDRSSDGLVHPYDKIIPRMMWCLMCGYGSPAEVEQRERAERAEEVAGLGSLSVITERDQLRAELRVMTFDRDEWKRRWIVENEKLSAELAEANRIMEGEPKMSKCFRCGADVPPDRDCDCRVSEWLMASKVERERAEKAEADLAEAKTQLDIANAKLLETTRRYAHQSVDLAAAQRVVEKAEGYSVWVEDETCARMRAWAESHEGTWPQAVRDLLDENKRLHAELARRIAVEQEREAVAVRALQSIGRPTEGLTIFLLVQELVAVCRIVELCKHFGVDMMRHILDYEPGMHGRDWRKKLAVHLSELLDKALRATPPKGEKR